MSALFKQDARMGHLTTVLGADTLVLLQIVTDEHVNDLFTIKVEALSQDDDIDFDALIGTYAGLGKPAVEERLSNSYPTLE